MTYPSDQTRRLIFDTLKKWETYKFPTKAEREEMFTSLEKLATHWRDDELAVWAYGYAHLGLILYPSGATIRRMLKKLAPWGTIKAESA